MFPSAISQATISSSSSVVVRVVQCYPTPIYYYIGDHVTEWSDDVCFTFSNICMWRIFFWSQQQHWPRGHGIDSLCCIFKRMTINYVVGKPINKPRFFFLKRQKKNSSRSYFDIFTNNDMQSNSMYHCAVIIALIDELCNFCHTSLYRIIAIIMVFLNGSLYLS